MAYVLSRTMSLESMRSYVVQVIAGLNAVSELAPLAAPWRGEKDALGKQREARDADLDLEVETSARVRVCDAEWDLAVGQLSKTALYLAGGNAKKEPYAQLFGGMKAQKMRSLGPAKASVVAAALVAKCSAMTSPEMLAAAQEIAQKTEALAAAENADAAAEAKVLTHGVERAKTLRRWEGLIAETEVAILTRYPGRDDLVRAILDPTPERRSSKQDEASNDTTEAA